MMLVPSRRAEQTCREAEVRGKVTHPFRFGSFLPELTSLSQSQFIDQLRIAGFELPESDPDGSLPWLAWADLYVDVWTEPQLKFLWEICNRVRFFRVRERFGNLMHCLVRVEWEPDWHGDAVTYYLPVAEGGIPLSVWYDRAAAEKDRDAKQKLAADEVAAAMFSIDHSGCLFNSNRKLEAAEPFADRPLDDPVPVGEALHCELTEVERGNFFQRNIAKTA